MEGFGKTKAEQFIKIVLLVIINKNLIDSDETGKFFHPSSWVCPLECRHPLPIETIGVGGYSDTPHRLGSHGKGCLYGMTAKDIEGLATVAENSIPNHCALVYHPVGDGRIAYN